MVQRTLQVRYPCIIVYSWGSPDAVITTSGNYFVLYPWQHHALRAPRPPPQIWYETCCTLCCLQPTLSCMQALMDLDQDSLDEATIAAYLAGTLSPDEREAVERKLTRDADARELLCMAQEAMDAAMDVPDGAEPETAVPANHPDDGDRPATRRPNRLARFGWYAGIAVVVFALGLSLRLVLGPPNDVLRSNTPPASFTVEVNTPDLHFHWPKVADVYTYKVSIWDPAAAQVVAEHQTADTQIPPADPFMQTLRDRLHRGKEYSVRVDAINAENRVIQRSSLAHFELAP